MNMSLASLSKAKGNVLVLTALSLVVLMGVAGLAIDLSHAEVNKTRLQNLADALALSAAISLNKQESGTLSGTTYTDKEEYAENYAKEQTLPTFKASLGNNEVTLAASNFTFKFATDWSATADDWKAANAITNAKFARVEIEAKNAMSIKTWFAGVMGFNNMAVTASAVAGTIPTAPCNLAPIMMCAGPPPVDTDCSDGNCYGYILNNIYCLTPAGSGGSGFKCEASGNSEWGPGNIGFVDLGEALGIGGGATTLKDALAKDPSFSKYCSTNLNSLPGKTGNNWGPVKSGIDSLFNDPVISGKYSDTITGLSANGLITNSAAQSSSLTYLDWTKISSFNSPAVPQIPKSTGLPLSTLTSNGVPSPYEVYKTFKSQKETNIPAASSKFGQRVISIAFVNCTNPPNGSSGVSPVVGFGCFFLPSKYQKQGSEEFIMGQFISDPSQCQSVGKATVTGNYGFYKVQLYKDPFGGHS